jgi:hypothetical protein
MCTVTYLPPQRGRNLVLTSNRDELDYRETIPPKIYTHNGISICYPKDTLASGSWIAMNSNGRIVCLLNGAFEAHKKELYHTNSRGQALLQLAASDKETLNYFNEQNLKTTQPFTIITIDVKDEKIIYFSEFIWNGKNKFFRLLEHTKPYIWSSATLYKEEVRKERCLWFSELLKKEMGKISPKLIYNFHNGVHTSDKTNNVLVEREGGLKTVSITQIVLDNSQIQMNYMDKLTDTMHKIRL